jgi:anti-anti-sigma factor
MVTVSRLFDPAVIERFAVALNELLKVHSQVVIDLSNVQFISSAMLGRLVMTWMETTTRGGNIVLCSANETISEIFHIAGLDQRLQLYPDQVSALAALNGKLS